MALPAAKPAARIPLPLARFAPGDKPEWAQTDFDDRNWKTLRTDRPWESQGFAELDGFAWYRIHVVIPSSLKAGSDWPERLRVYLGTLDDADEVYFNGNLIGKTGRMPLDAGGYESRWQTLRDYLVDLKSNMVRWDANNVIAIRVFDGVGQGGFLGREAPYVAVPMRAEGVDIDPARARHRFVGGDNVQIGLTVANRFAVPQQGELHLQARDHATGRWVMQAQEKLSLGPGQHKDLELTLPSRPGIEAHYRYVDGSSGLAVSASHVIPYVLTPADPAAPAIHGARLLGARPGTPLRHRVPATGAPPLRFAAEGLPADLQINGDTGVITGTMPAAGRYPVKLKVSNGQGQALMEWTLVAGDTLALTPPLGWNSWHALGLTVGDAQVREAAQALIDQGLAAKGWNLLTVDDGWQATKRGADGSLAPNTRFPNMPALAQHLHALGLRLGLYSSPGPTSCSLLAGSFENEARDAAVWSTWGIDYLKYELCSYADKLPARASLRDHQKPFALMGQLLRQQPRSIVYNLSQYGEEKVWTWGAEAGANSWRVTGDIQDSWQDLLATGFALAPYTRWVGPGRYNDADVLMLGDIGAGDRRPTRLTADEQYTQVSLWALLASPMFLSNHLPTLDEFTRSLVTNGEVIAVHQDALAVSAQRVLERGPWQVWVKELEGGGKAVGVFNTGASFARFQLDPVLFGRGGQAYVARDVWRQRDLSSRTTPLPVAVPAHGVALFTVK